MEDKPLVSDLEISSPTAKPYALKAILYSGLTVGVLDGIAATVSTMIRGGTPIRVFQYIASGLLGQSAFQGGISTFALGLLLHFVVAFGACVVFIFAGKFLPVLSRVPFYITGPIYGVLVYFVMRDVVIPMSLVTRLNYNASASAIGIIIHILFVGLPIAFINSRFTKEYTS
ncbi:MAG: hypothetical protein ABL984_11710 [Pyrinomonadaceae bacterium]